MFDSMFKEDSFMMKKVLPFFNALGKSRFIQSINSGLFFAMPMIFVGVVLQIVGAISTVALGAYPAVQALISSLQNWGFGLMGLFICIGVAKTNAQLNKIVVDGPIVFAVTIYFMLLKPVFGADGTISLNFSYLGAQGLTLALIAGFAGAEICALFERKGWTIKAKNLPQFMTSWFTNLLAGTLMIVLTWLIVYVWNVDVMAAIQKADRSSAGSFGYRCPSHG
jgi:Phosphotransferase system cellobiose-specific component IIC